MKTRGEHFAWVRKLHLDCLEAIEAATVNNTNPEVMQEFTEYMDHKIYEEHYSPAQAAVLYAWDQMDEEHKNMGAQLEWGYVGAGLKVAPHCWIRVNAQELAGEDGQLADVNQDVIIDPASPGVTPSCLLVHRSSPLWAFYTPQAADEKKKTGS